MSEMTAEEWSLAFGGIRKEKCLSILSRDLPGTADLKDFRLVRTNNNLNLLVVGREPGQTPWTIEVQVIRGEQHCLDIKKIFLPGERRKHGLGRVMARNILRLSEIFRVTRFTAHASMAGSFMALRVGFLPTDQVWPAFRKRLVIVLNETLAGNIDFDVENFVNFFSSSSPVSMRALIPNLSASILEAGDLTIESGVQGRPSASWKILAESGLDWDAVLSFDDQVGWQMFKEYATGR